VRRTILFTSLAIASAIGSQQVVRGFQASELRRVTPMTLTEVEYAITFGQTPSLTKRWRIAYRSDGSVACASDETGSYHMRTVLLTSEKAEIRAVDPLKLKTTVPLSENRIASMRFVQTTSDCQDPAVVKR
jgi:transposase-like protein